MTFKLLVVFGLIMSAYYWIPKGFSNGYQENNPPKVTITLPSGTNHFDWNSLVSYTIKVMDAEDGNSDYNEIAPNEVFLEISFFQDSIQAKKHQAERSKRDTQLLLWLSTAACFNCHAIKSKVIGPSFQQIAEKYKNNPTTVETLTKKIISGSSGTWGDLKMPPHPDLEISKIRETVQWMLNNNIDPNKNYLPGIEGTFRTIEKPKGEFSKGIYVLTATYMDHGIKNIPGTNKEGKHTIVLKSNR